jgi:hypothetical protein
MVGVVESRGVGVGAITSPFLGCHIHGDGAPKGAIADHTPAGGFGAYAGV